jgi:hypothetical protein
MTWFRSRLTFSNVVALIALFVALGGSSYAAVKLSKNSVKSRHIAPRHVKASDLGRNAVRSDRVRDGSLLSQDFAPGQLPTGPQGEPGVSGREVVTSTVSRTSSQTNASADATCPSGKTVMGGGALINRHPDERTYLVTSWPKSDTTWTAFADSNDALTQNWSLTVYAICATTT